MTPNNVPKHIAIIPDGNRRWAKEKGLPSFEGHRRGFNRVGELLKTSRKLGIKVFTLWAFSTENWKRTKAEVDYLMKMYEDLVEQNLKEALKDKVRIIHLGRKDRLPLTLQEKIIDAEKQTKNFTKHYLVIALDYGGHDEILRAVKKMQSFNEDNFAQFLDTKDLPYPNVDLIIRTSGEQRTSGFMIWQSAYAEYVFLNKYFPDFTSSDFTQCIEEYKARQRRYGR